LPANAIGWPLLSFGFALLVFAGADGHSLVGRWRVPGAGWIAAISYSLYLSHKIAFHLVQALLGTAWQQQRTVTFVAYALAVLALGAALHYLVERPFLQLRARRASSARQPLREPAVLPAN